MKYQIQIKDDDGEKHILSAPDGECAEYWKNRIMSLDTNKNISCLFFMPKKPPTWHIVQISGDEGV